MKTQIDREMERQIGYVGASATADPLDTLHDCIKRLDALLSYRYPGQQAWRELTAQQIARMTKTLAILAAERNS